MYLYGPGKEAEMKVSLQSVCRNLVGAYPILAVHGTSIRKEVMERISGYYRSIASTCLEPGRKLQWIASPKHDPDGKFELHPKEEGYHTRKRAARKPHLDASRSAKVVVNAKAHPQARSTGHQLSSTTARRQQPYSLLQTGSRDYKAMIAFWLFDAFELAQEHGFDYLMRLDTDSILDTQPKEDPFRAIRDKQAVYGYRAFCYDNYNSTPMWKRLGDYVDKEKITPTFQGFRLNNTGPAPMVYTNFEVANVSFFRRGDVQKFTHDMLHETAASRLGDAVIRVLQLGLFAQENQVIHLDDFRYRHGCNRWWWIKNKTADCAIEERDPFIIDWQKDPARFGPPIGHCYSSRLDTKKVAEQSVMKAPESKAKRIISPPRSTPEHKWAMWASSVRRNHQHWQDRRNSQRR